jgi:transcriptional regulator with XRE-family HTH domain
LSDLKRSRYCDLVSHTSGDWSNRLAALIARQVRAYRRERGLSVQQLSDALARLGCDMKRPVLSNFENGRRPTISVAELFALALALDVPPIQLIFPIGQAEHVEIPFDSDKIPSNFLPNDTLPLDTWAAAQWFTGELVIRTVTSDAGGQSVIHDKQAAAPIALYREHDDLSLKWRLSKDGARKARSVAQAATDDEERDGALGRADILEREALRFERELARTRQEMRSQEINPPTLPRALRHIDDDTGDA